MNVLKLFRVKDNLRIGDEVLISGCDEGLNRFDGQRLIISNFERKDSINIDRKFCKDSLKKCNKTSEEYCVKAIFKEDYDKYRYKDNDFYLACGICSCYCIMTKIN